MTLLKVISGGQDGVDIAALRAARALGIPTGGHMPQNFLTSSGFRPEYKKKYGMQTTRQATYPPRTYLNVAHADMTIRLAYDFSSKGEEVTLSAIRKYKKPFVDVDIYIESDSIIKGICSIEADPQFFASKIKTVDPTVINIAGNRPILNLEAVAEVWLTELFTILAR